VSDIDFSQHIGRSTGSGVVTVDRSTVTAFAAAVLDTNPVYRNRDVAQAMGFADVPAPPTYFFSAAQSFDQREEDQPDEPDQGDPMVEVMGALMANGGLILHGEQAFTYQRPVVVGERLRYQGVVKDIYQKQSGDRTMTFVVVETTFTDESGEPVVTSTMNVIHRS
jgi:acyl dehydratase